MRNIRRGVKLSRKDIAGKVKVVQKEFYILVSSATLIPIDVTVSQLRLIN
jgi:hypothetical protein